MAAKRNAMPISAKSASVAGAGRSITTPSASSTSAAPHAEDAARFPCLTIGTPAEAATIVAIVDTLTVCKPSPPVPTGSVTGPPMVIGVHAGARDADHHRRRVRQHGRGQPRHLLRGLS